MLLLQKEIQFFCLLTTQKSALLIRKVKIQTMYSLDCLSIIMTHSFNFFSRSLCARRPQLATKQITTTKRMRQILSRTLVPYHVCASSKFIYLSRNVVCSEGLCSLHSGAHSLRSTAAEGTCQKTSPPKNARLWRRRRSVRSSIQCDLDKILSLLGTKWKGHNKPEQAEKSPRILKISFQGRDIEQLLSHIYRRNGEETT